MDETEGTPNDPENAPNGDVTGENGEATANDTKTSDEDDALEAYYKLRAEQDLERMRAEAMAEAERRLRDEYEAASRQTQTEEEQRQLTEAFTTAIKTSRDNLKKLTITDAEGKEYGLTDEQIEEFVVKPFQAYNSRARDSVQTSVYTDLAKTAMNVLPPAAREEFAKKATGKPLNEWLLLLSDHLAENTAYVKQMKKDHEIAVKAAEARGAAARQKIPGGSPSQAGERARSGDIDLSSYSSAARALAEGLISNEQFLEARNKLANQGW